VVDIQPRKPQQLKYKEQRKITCSHVQHPPTHESNVVTQVAHHWDLIATKYKERTIKRPPAEESQDRSRPWKRGVFKEQTQLSSYKNSQKNTNQLSCVAAWTRSKKTSREAFKKKKRRRFVDPYNWRCVGYARWRAMAVIHSKKKIRRAV